VGVSDGRTRTAKREKAFWGSWDCPSGWGAVKYLDRCLRSRLQKLLDISVLGLAVPARRLNGLVEILASLMGIVATLRRRMRVVQWLADVRLRDEADRTRGAISALSDVDDQTSALRHEKGQRSRSGGVLLGVVRRVREKAGEQSSCNAVAALEDDAPVILLVWDGSQNALEGDVEEFALQLRHLLGVEVGGKVLLDARLDRAGQLVDVRVLGERLSQGHTLGRSATRSTASESAPRRKLLGRLPNHKYWGHAFASPKDASMVISLCNMIATMPIGSVSGQGLRRRLACSLSMASLVYISL
jgi:hypothetical protein